MADPTLSTILLAHVAGAEAARRSVVNVESEADPRRPGRTAYRLTGRDKDAVRLQAAKLLQQADEAGGYGRFIVGPDRLDDGSYGALGEVVLRQPAEGA